MIKKQLKVICLALHGNINMENTLKENAYHVLGLDIHTSQKDIIKRSKEIINRLKIDDIPEYPLDIGLFESFRTEESVNEAIQKLQAPKKKIKEYFFWFQISDNIDESVLDFIKEKSYSNAINTWKEAAETSNTQCYSYKKNLALLYCILLSQEDNEHYLQDSLSIWKELIESDKFWDIFSKIYKFYDDQAVSEESIKNFKTSSISYLSDIYTELHSIHNTPNYINEFQRYFSSKSDKMESNVLEPIYHAINNFTEQLDDIIISENVEEFIEQEAQVNTIIESIKDQLNRLSRLGLYDDSQTKVIRDKISESIRNIVIDIHNNLEEREKAMQLLGIALEICGTMGLREKIIGEVEKIKDNIDDDNNNPFRHCLFCNDVVKNISSFMKQKMHKVTRTENSKTYYLTKTLPFPRCSRCKAYHKAIDKKFSIIGLCIGLPIGIFSSIYAELAIWDSILLGSLIITAFITAICVCILYSFGFVSREHHKSKFLPYKELLADGWKLGAEPSNN